MSSDKLKSALFATAGIAACAVIGVGVGCYYGGVATGEANASPVISYVTEESTVYSSTADMVDAVAKSVVEIRTESITTSWG